MEGEVARRLDRSDSRPEEESASPITDGIQSMAFVGCDDGDDEAVVVVVAVAADVEFVFRYKERVICLFASATIV